MKPVKIDARHERKWRIPTLLVTEELVLVTLWDQAPKSMRNVLTEAAKRIGEACDAKALALPLEGKFYPGSYSVVLSTPGKPEAYEFDLVGNLITVMDLHKLFNIAVQDIRGAA